MSTTPRVRQPGRRGGPLLPVLAFLILVALAVGAALLILRTPGAEQAGRSATGTTSTRSGGESTGSGSAQAPAASEEPEAAAPVEAAEATEEGEFDARSAAGGAAGEENFHVVRVFYGTDRQKTGSSKPNDFYGGERGTFEIGTADVSIPKDHRIGALEAPSIWRFEFSEDPEKHVVLLEVKPKPVDEFYREVAERVGQSTSRDAFIFIHGYNVSFRDAARRTAQMTYDLEFKGAPVFYSWPSQGTTFGYPKDETNVQWTQPHLKQFILDFAQKSTAENIFLVAHSMGNRALTAVLPELVREHPEIKPKIKEIILAAPDIDAEIFVRDIAPAMARAGAVVTLYSSSKDWALEASKQFHGYRRAGDSVGGVTIADGVDTIDSSDVDTGLIGHAYYGESKSIIADLYEIFHERKRPAERSNLRRIEDQLGKYWKFLRKGN